jgi:hypothetical protein
MDLAPVASFFWDYDISLLTWERNQDFIIRRILQSGDFQSLRWLRTNLGDAQLRSWMINHNGHGLTPRQIRYWALMLDIQPDLADTWVKAASNTTWEKRR